MCGIFGAIAPDLEPSAVQAATHRLRHRGPDDQAIYLSPDRAVGLGACRLSILDLSNAGRQPMANEDRSIWITYNGEIYNYRDIRRELEREGHTFKSQTDTEVILRAYEQWGPGCLSRLRGMFAFGIWDERQKSLFLARDRVGIKPLYYYWDGTRFIFASELKAIESFPRLDLRVDSSALYDFLTYRYIPEPKTPYVNVRKLLPAHYLVSQSDYIYTRSYWDVDFDGREIRSEGKAIEALTAQLEETIGIHLNSDVPLGIFASGGIDSSCVVALTSKRFSSEKLKTFSIGFDQPAYSEVQYARIVAETYGTEHIERIMTGRDAKEILASYMKIYDEPFGDSSAIPTYAVSRLAREQVKVVLTGDGGDEVFGGYNWYSYFMLYRKFHWIPPLPVNILLRSFDFFQLNIRGRSLLSTLALEPLEAYANLLGGFTQTEKGYLLDHSKLGEIIRVPSDYNDYWYFKQYWNEKLDLMSRLQYLDFKTYLPADILTKVDRASMAASLEVRPPLLDHKLIELVASIDPQIRNRHKIKKYLFNRAMQGVLPEKIVSRKKKGFSPPLSWWMYQEDVLRMLNGEIRNTCNIRQLKPSKRFCIAVLQCWLREKGVDTGI